MRTEEIRARVLTIHDAPKLDPITVVLQDVGPGQGRLIVECWCSAWAAYWGGMGDRTLAEFIASCDACYVSGKLLPSKYTKRDEAYLLRIVEAVQIAIRGCCAAATNEPA